MSEMAEAIRELIQAKGYSEESVRQTIENALKAAYKRTYGTSENAIVKFEDDMSDVAIFSRKTVVDGVYDPVTEIELEDAKKLSSECELGDEIDIREDPKTFDRSAVATDKQTAHQGLNETFKIHFIVSIKIKLVISLLVIISVNAMVIFMLIWEMLVNWKDSFLRNISLLVKNMKKMTELKLLLLN